MIVDVTVGRNRTTSPSYDFRENSACELIIFVRRQCQAVCWDECRIARSFVRPLAHRRRCLDALPTLFGRRIYVLPASTSTQVLHENVHSSTVHVLAGCPSYPERVHGVPLIGRPRGLKMCLEIRCRLPPVTTPIHPWCHPSITVGSKKPAPSPRATAWTLLLVGMLSWPPPRKLESSRQFPLYRCRLGGGPQSLFPNKKPSL